MQCLSRKVIQVFFLLIATAFHSYSQQQNAVIPGDFADPSVILVNGTYYATGTSSEWAPHYPLFTSKDLRQWSQLGYAFKTTPGWTMSSFWAPELYYRNGLYYLYYTARAAADSISCIGVATSTDPANGFTDHGPIVKFGREAIDAFIIEDSNKLYITWKAYGLDKRPIELLGAELSDDGLKVIGEPFSMLKDSARKGMEGQCIVHKNGQYYLFYSGGGCCGRDCSYFVSVARSASLRGPYVNHPGNPILSEDSTWKCPGHGTLVETPGHEWFYLHHAYNKADDVYTGRQGLLTALDWSGDWPKFLTSSNANITAPSAITDKFNASQIADHWQWDFRYVDPIISTGGGKLCLSGQTDNKANPTGTVITVRPYDGNYEMTVRIDNYNEALKGLSLYGDATQAVGIGTRGNNVEVWQVKDGKRNVLQQQQLPGSAGVELMMRVEKGYLLTFYWKKRSQSWKPVGALREQVNADFLPPWDRSPRPGLHHNGSADMPACFSNFKIKYNRKT